MCNYECLFPLISSLQCDCLFVFLCLTWLHCHEPRNPNRNLVSFVPTYPLAIMGQKIWWIVSPKRLWSSNLLPRSSCHNSRSSSYFSLLNFWTPAINSQPLSQEAIFSRLAVNFPHCLQAIVLKNHLIMSISLFKMLNHPIPPW